MRTLRIDAATALVGSEYIADPIDLFSYNLTTLRRDDRQLLGRFSRVDMNSLEVLLLFKAVVVEGWATATAENKAMLTAAAANGVGVYIDQGSASLLDAIEFATDNAITGVYAASQSAQDADDIIQAGLVPATNQDGEIGRAHGLVVYEAVEETAYSDLFLGNVSDAATTIHKLAYGTPVSFYLNSDPQHWPGTSDITTDVDIQIPASTIVQTDSGARFMVLENTLITAGSSSANAFVIPLDQFTSVGQYEITTHNTDVPNVYVTNDEIVQAQTVVCVDNPMLSFALGLASSCTAFSCPQEDPTMADPRIYMGESVSEAAVGTKYNANAWILTTDIGPVTIIPDLGHIEVDNLLISVSHHLIGGSSYLEYRTAATLDGISTTQYLPYSNDAVLERYVQFRTGVAGAGEAVDITGSVTFTDDGDTINYPETDRMVDQLPLWMKWREEGSTGYEMTNIAGRFINDLFGYERMISRYHLADLDPTVNGCAVVIPVDEDWMPATGDVIVGGVTAVLAADTDELLMSAYPAMYLSESMLYVVRASEADILILGQAPVGATVTNLWTHFDEWGLMFNLDRFTGESVSRFRQRIMDIFPSGFGANKVGLAAAAARELSPVGLSEDEFTNRHDEVSVIGLDDSSMKDADGFQTPALSEAVLQQRLFGVHTWDNAKYGAAVFDADGPEHVAQGRLPYVYDTPLGDIDSLLSGAGPKEDMHIIKGGLQAFPVSLELKKDGYETVPEYEGRALLVTVGFTGTGTYKLLPTEMKKFIVKVTITTNEAGSPSYYRVFQGFERSNVNANAVATQAGYNNTLIHSFDIVPRHRDGGLALSGTWYKSSNDTPGKPASTAAITAIAIDNQSVAGTAQTWVQYVTSGDVFWDGTGTNGQKSTGDYSLAASSYTSKSGVKLLVRVSPFDASGAQQSASYNTKQVTKKVLLYGDLANGSPTGASATFRAPDLYFAPYVTNQEITATVIDVAPVDNMNIVGPSETPTPLSITNEVISDILQSLTLESLDAGKMIWKITHDPSAGLVSTAWPYVRPATSACSSSSVVEIPEISNMQTIKMTLLDEQIPQLPEGAVETSFSIKASKPGIIATLSGNELSVTRADDPNIAKLIAHRGYYWLSGAEDYMYSAAETETTNVAGGASVTNVALLKQPAHFSLVKVTVNDVPLAYRFYQGPDGTKVFTADGVPAYTGSFYVSDQKVYFSEAVEGPATIVVTYEPEDAVGSVDTGIVTSPLSSWGDRYFVVAAPDIPRTAHTVEVSVDKTSLSSTRGALGCNDIAFVCALVKDADGNPIDGASVTWAASAGTILKSMASTGADGRATAYYSSSVAGTATVTATVDTVPGTVDILVSSVGTTAEVTEIVATYPTMVQSGTDFVAELEAAIAGDVPVDWSLYVITCPGTENVNGTWPSASQTGSLYFTNSKCTLRMSNLAEGFYKMVVGSAVMIWRVY